MSTIIDKPYQPFHLSPHSRPPRSILHSANKQPTNEVKSINLNSEYLFHITHVTDANCSTICYISEPENMTFKFQREKHTYLDFLAISRIHT